MGHLAPPASRLDRAHASVACLVMTTALQPPRLTGLLRSFTDSRERPDLTRTCSPTLRAHSRPAGGQTGQAPPEDGLPGSQAGSAGTCVRIVSLCRTQILSVSPSALARSHTEECLCQLPAVAGMQGSCWHLYDLRTGPSEGDCSRGISHSSILPGLEAQSLLLSGGRCNEQHPHPLPVFTEAKNKADGGQNGCPWAAARS